MKIFLLLFTTSLTFLGCSYYGYCFYDNSYNEHDLLANKKIEYRLLAQDSKFLTIKKVDTSIVSVYYKGKKKAVINVSKESDIKNLSRISS